jgi:hypothetical protein
MIESDKGIIGVKIYTKANKLAYYGNNKHAPKSYQTLGTNQGQ